MLSVPLDNGNAGSGDEIGINRVRSLLSMRGMLLGYSFPLGLITVRLLQQDRLLPSVYQQINACTRTNQFDERKHDEEESKISQL